MLWPNYQISCVVPDRGCILGTYRSDKVSRDKFVKTPSLVSQFALTRRSHRGDGRMVADIATFPEKQRFLLYVMNGSLLNRAPLESMAFTLDGTIADNRVMLQ